ncbi:MAG TPA: hypothetical protein VMN36_02445 [Verrucomicrobiales bacterium]|nr:hypothetical protein [Verrucomicrobiales bacterium]
MKLSLHFFAVAVVATALFSGCTSVTSRQLAGAAPVTLEAEKWEGVWTDDNESVLFIRVKDSTGGVLEVGNVERNEEEMKFTKFDVMVRQSGDWLWANFKEKEDSPYSFARISAPDRHLLVWIPDPAAFVRRVRAGDMQGELLKDDQGKETGSVIVDEISADHITAIQSGEWSGVLDLSRPWILRRLGARPGP